MTTDHGICQKYCNLDTKEFAFVKNHEDDSNMLGKPWQYDC